MSDIRFLAGRAFAGVFALALIAGAAQAQTYPVKPVTIIVPLAAGSGTDLVARVYGQELAKTLGKPVVVENRTGAATMIGTNYVATSPPDGHTLLVATSSAMAINPTLYKKIAYEPLKDFVPIAWYLKSPFVLCIHPDIPARSLRELIKHAKERPVAADLRLARRGHRAAPVGGVHQAPVRHRDHPRALSQQSAIRLRRGRRASQPGLHRNRDRQAAHRREEGDRARVFDRRAAGNPARHTDARRSVRRAGHRNRVLAHAVRAGGDAEGRRRPAACRHEGDHLDAGVPQAARPTAARCRSRRRRSTA